MLVDIADLLNIFYFEKLKAMIIYISIREEMMAL